LEKQKMTQKTLSIW